MTGVERLPFFTIGHSTWPIPDFVDLLRLGEVSLVIDVRTIPRSRTNPQFNRDALPASLADRQIGYEHIAELGGLRSRRRGDEASPNSFWSNPSFRNYADYAGTEPFCHGLERLVALGRQRRCALMCAEAVWWRCHRRIIADYLLAQGEAVFHIMAPGRLEPATITPAATVQPDGSLRYE